MNGLHGFNVRTIGVSRDQVIAAQRQVGGALLLAMNDPQLVIEAKTTGCKLIYRQFGDETLNQDPAEFVRTRAEKGADYVHLTNELGSSPALHQWTRRALEAATALGVKAVAYNYATHAPYEQWVDAEDNLRYAVAHGHAIGAHVYLDGAHDSTAFTWNAMRQRIGGQWFITEFGFIRDYQNPHQGWRGQLNPAQRQAFIARWTPYFRDRNVPLCWFCFDPWDQPNVEAAKASGFGYWDYKDVLDYMAVLNIGHQVVIGDKPVTVRIPAPTTGGKLATLTRMPGEFINVRDQPNGSDAGDLLLGDTVIYFPDATSDGWVYQSPVTQVARPAGRQAAKPGWVSKQAGTVVFSEVPPADGNLTVSLADWRALEANNIEIVQRAAANDAIIQRIKKGVKPPPSGDTF